MVNRYSLADYRLEIEIPEGVSYGNYKLTGRLSIGGPGATGDGSFLGQVSIARNSSTWSTTGDYTGSWVHQKNLDKTGTVSLQIRQVSDDILRLMMIASVYEQGTAEDLGMTLTVFKGTDQIATATDCFISQIPQQDFAGEAGLQTWAWTCGRITFAQYTDKFFDAETV